MPLKGEFFLAWHYLRPQKSIISLLTYTSLLGPVLGVGILVVVVSVMNGIPRELEKKLVSYSAHITIADRQPLTGVAKLMTDVESKYSGKSSPVTLAPVLIESHSGASEVLIAKGLLPEKDEQVSQLHEMIDKKTMPAYRLELNEVIISKNISEQLKVKPGDEVILHSPEKYKRQLEEQSAAFSNNNQQFIVAGIFSTGVPDIDKNFMVMHLSTANELMALKPNQATQIEIALDNPAQAEAMALKMAADRRLKNLSVTPWQRQHSVQSLYRLVNDQKAMMVFVLFFIVIGAAIGVAACLFSLVIQKTKEIGILKATGVKPASIVTVFLLMGTFLGSLGATLGLAGGLLTLFYRQEVTAVFGFWDKELYKLENVPVFYDSSDISFILIIAVLICVAASTIPAILAAAVHPAQALQSQG